MVFISTPFYGHFFKRTRKEKQTVVRHRSSLVFLGSLINTANKSTVRLTRKDWFYNFKQKTLLKNFGALWNLLKNFIRPTAQVSIRAPWVYSLSFSCSVRCYYRKMRRQRRRLRKLSSWALAGADRKFTRATMANTRRSTSSDDGNEVWGKVNSPLNRSSNNIWAALFSFYLLDDNNLDFSFFCCKIFK